MFELVFGVEQDGEPRHVAAGSLLRAAALLRKRASKGLNVSTYWIVGSPMPGLVPPGSASWATGIIINGEQYWLKGGIEQCLLEKVGLSADGKRIEAKESTDVRHLKKIATDNMGEMRIQKRSKPGRILSVLRQIEEKINELPSDCDVVITVG